MTDAVYAGALAAFAIVLSFVFVLRLRRRLPELRATRRHDAGHCPRCDYDLRASRGACPECGATIEHAEDFNA